MDKDKPTQVDALLDIELIAAYSPEARGRERMSGPCRNACPRNSGSPASPRSEANRSSGRSTCRQRPLRNPGRGQGLRLRALRIDDILCVQQERTVGRNSALPRLSLHPPARHRVKARVRVHEYPDGTLALFHVLGGAGCSPRRAHYRRSILPVNWRSCEAIASLNPASAGGARAIVPAARGSSLRGCG